MFNPSDKVIRVGSTNPLDKNVRTDYFGPQPEMNKVYCVEEFWDTAIGPQLMLVGFGPAPFYNGHKTGWACKHFRLLSEIKAENIQRQDDLRIPATVRPLRSAKGALDPQQHSMSGSNNDAHDRPNPVL